MQKLADKVSTGMVTNRIQNIKINYMCTVGLFNALLKKQEHEK
jgi:hypothetical protein